MENAHQDDSATNLSIGTAINVQELQTPTDTPNSYSIFSPETALLVEQLAIEENTGKADAESERIIRRVKVETPVHFKRHPKTRSQQQELTEPAEKDEDYEKIPKFGRFSASEITELPILAASEDSQTLSSPNDYVKSLLHKTIAIGKTQKSNYGGFRNMSPVSSEKPVNSGGKATSLDKDVRFHALSQNKD